MILSQTKFYKGGRGVKTGLDTDLPRLYFYFLATEKKLRGKEKSWNLNSVEKIGPGR